MSLLIESLPKEVQKTRLLLHSFAYSSPFMGLHGTIQQVSPVLKVLKGATAHAKTKARFITWPENHEIIELYFEDDTHAFTIAYEMCRSHSVGLIFRDTHKHSLANKYYEVHHEGLLMSTTLQFRLRVSNIIEELL